MTLKILKRCLLLLGAMAIIVGCDTLLSSQNNSDNSESTESLSEVTYSPEELKEFQDRVQKNAVNRYKDLQIPTEPLLVKPDSLPADLLYGSQVDIPYPAEGVKGIYLTESNVSNPEYFDEIIDYIDQTELNAVVLNFKDDWGNILQSFETDNPNIEANITATVDYHKILEKLASKQIYPIARIVTFKDSRLAELRPDLSFHDISTGEIWSDGGGSKFINPFLQETWDYIISIAEEAAKLGFKEIQFDYIRFPEGFHVFSQDLEYELGGYAAYVSEDPELEGQERTQAIADFLDYAREKLAPYDVEISADVFGYTAVAGNAPDVRGIGQDFKLMAERVDVVSSMIYPSHWSEGFFGFDYPDLYPYDFTKAYMHEEANVLAEVANPVRTRPWLQDFTADYLPEGTYMYYGPQEVEDQIRALKELGVHEFLLWNAAGDYSRPVNYDPPL